MLNVGESGHRNIHIRPTIQRRNDRYREAGKRYADRQRRERPSDISVGDKVLVKIPNRLTKLSGAFFTEPYTVVSVKGSQVTVRRPSDDRLFKRNRSFVKRYVAPRDFVEPLSPPCSASSASEATPSVRADCSSDVVAGHGTELCTRSGRRVVKPQWFGDVVSH